MRPEEPEDLGFSAPAQRAAGQPARQPAADLAEPQADRVGTDSHVSNASHAAHTEDESASAPRRRTGHEEVTDLAYEAADHTQDFAEEIEDAVRSLIPSASLNQGLLVTSCAVVQILCTGTKAQTSQTSWATLWFEKDIHPTCPATLPVQAWPQAMRSLSVLGPQTSACHFGSHSQTIATSTSGAAASCTIRPAVSRQ